jgi:hypothetical protein
MIDTPSPSDSTLYIQPNSFLPVGNSGTSWHVANAEIASAYKAFSVDKIMGRVGVYIGLDHANVTLGRDSPNS